jgi:hypothetical protein
MKAEDDYVLWPCGNDADFPPDGQMQDGLTKTTATAV